MNVKGTWAIGTSYSVGDVVKYMGTWYHLQKPCAAGVTPHDTAYWGRKDPQVDGLTELAESATENAGHVKTDDVYNKLDRTSAGKVLDARQGKALKTLIDGCLTADDIEDSLDSDSATKALSAKQGKALKGYFPDAKTLRLQSSTASSEKIFDITVDDDGELTATEYTPAAET